MWYPIILVNWQLIDVIKILLLNTKVIDGIGLTHWPEIYLSKNFINGISIIRINLI